MICIHIKEIRLGVLVVSKNARKGSGNGVVSCVSEWFRPMCCGPATVKLAREKRGISLLCAPVGPLRHNDTKRKHTDTVPSMDTANYCISLESVQAARGRVEALVSRTPVLTCSTLDALSGRQLFFKCEFMQKTGSFKARGATNALVKNQYPAVVTHSSGNHGQVQLSSVPYIVFNSTYFRILCSRH